MIIAISFLIAIAMAISGFVFQTSISGITRKTIARIQKRYGPVWYQNFRDVFKLLNKRSVTHGWGFDLGLLIAMAGAIGTAMFMTVGGIVAFKGFDNFFMIVYLAALSAFGRALSASASGNPLANIGVMRGLAQGLGYKIPYMIMIITVIGLNKTSSISGLVNIQQAQGWNLFLLPIGTIVAFISMHGSLGHKPFDTYYAPAELASGPMVEYGGKQLGMLMITNELTTFVEVSLFINIFLGGGATILEFIIKYFIVYTLTSYIGAVLGRFRIEQVVKFYYKVPLALAMVQVTIATIFGRGVI